MKKQQPTQLIDNLAKLGYGLAISLYYKTSVEDNYKNGETGQMSEWELTHNSKGIYTKLTELAEEYGLTTDANAWVLFDTGEGKLELQCDRLENELGEEMDTAERTKWKRGWIKGYDARYCFGISLVKTEAKPAMELLRAIFPNICDIQLDY